MRWAMIILLCCNGLVAGTVIASIWLSVRQIRADLQIGERRLPEPWYLGDPL